jgi:hypothetical protein
MGVTKKSPTVTKILREIRAGAYIAAIVRLPVMANGLIVPEYDLTKPASVPM